MEDLISREAVLENAFAIYTHECGLVEVVGVDTIKDLPSVKPQEPTTRNCFGCKYSKDNHNADTEECHLCMWENQYTPQEPEGHCKECKYFEYDSVAKVDGIPLIVAHEICNKWGEGCKTKEDGYCFLFEPRAESEVPNADSD